MIRKGIIHCNFLFLLLTINNINILFNTTKNDFNIKINYNNDSDIKTLFIVIKFFINLNDFPPYAIFNTKTDSGTVLKNKISLSYVIRMDIDMFIDSLTNTEDSPYANSGDTVTGGYNGYEIRYDNLEIYNNQISLWEEGLKNQLELFHNKYKW